MAGQSQENLLSKREAKSCPRKMARMAASMAPDDYCHHLPPACTGHRATPAVTRWRAARAADVAGSPGAGGMADTRYTTFLSSSVHQKPPATMGGVRTCHGAKCRHLVNPAQGTHPQRRLSPGHTTFPRHGHDTATGTTPPRAHHRRARRQHRRGTSGGAPPHHSSRRPSPRRPILPAPRHGHQA